MNLKELKNTAAASSAPKRGTRKPNEAGRLMPRDGIVTVRMYRIGHGDCFLLAFPTSNKDKPTYVLIDCGYKPGSTSKIPTGGAAIEVKEVCEDIRLATGGHIHVVVVTHEHQDHINGFTEANFKGIDFGQSWFAWTEDDEDELANRLRKKFGDKLILLTQARNALAEGNAAESAVNHIDDFLAFELGGEDEIPSHSAGEHFLAAASDLANSANKRALKVVRSKSTKGSKYLRPHTKPVVLPGVDGVRVFTLGPPRDEDLLESMDPEEGEGFERASKKGNDLAKMLKVGLGARSDLSTDGSPFARRYQVSWPLGDEGADFWKQHYGSGGWQGESESARPEQVPSAPSWRRIDHEWLHAAEALALDMNDETNNGSLVLAFELSPGGKVLLFAADAQRGNWVSWSRKDWKDGDREVSAKDLLARTVLYKVGHHGSHNATLNGTNASAHANLSWMGHGKYENEFTAMITAVRPWASKQKGWDHPLPSIKNALIEKASGRVFQTDTNADLMTRQGAASDWAAFQDRCRGTRLYLEYDIPIQD